MEGFMIIIILIACILLYEYKDDDEAFSVLLTIIIFLTVSLICNILLNKIWIIYINPCFP